MLRNLSQISSLIRTRPIEEVKPADYLKTMLLVCGYHIFNIHQKRQRPGRSNMMVVHPDKPSTAMWIYQRDDGKFIVRAWSDYQAFNQLIERLSDKDQKDLILQQGGTLNLREVSDTWVSWLSEASKKKALALGYS